MERRKTSKTSYFMQTVYGLIEGNRTIAGVAGRILRRKESQKKKKRNSPGQGWSLATGEAATLEILGQQKRTGGKVKYLAKNRGGRDFERGRGKKDGVRQDPHWVKNVNRTTIGKGVLSL